MGTRYILRSASEEEVKQEQLLEGKWLVRCWSDFTRKLEACEENRTDQNTNT